MSGTNEVSYAVSAIASQRNGPGKPSAHQSQPLALTFQRPLQVRI